MLTSYPHLEPRLRKSGAVTLFRPLAFTAWTETVDLRTECMYVDWLQGLELAQKTVCLKHS